MSHGIASAAVVSRIGVFNLGSQKIEGPTSVVAKSAEPLSRLEVWVTVDTTGRVIDAKAADDFDKLDPVPGLAAAREWRFRPQTFQGKPVIAVGSIAIDYAPPEDRPDPSVSFPDSTPAATEIKLERSACYGRCPSYQVSIRGDGRVHFSGDGFVLLTGVHEAHVEPAIVEALVRKFRAADFFGLKSEYSADVTDSSTQTLTVRAGESTKRVVDYVGRAVGMPAVVSDLEHAVDAAAGVDRWVNGNAATIPLLEAEGFDFRSEGAGDFAVKAVTMSSGRDGADDATALILAMIDKGLRLDRSAGLSGKAALGSVIAYRAAIAGNETLFRRMAEKGYVTGLSAKALTFAFASGAGCSPAIAEALAKQGADPKGGIDQATALIAIRSPGSACNRAGEERTSEMARTLIDLGVPPDARYDKGKTALMYCDSPALARVLLDHGADPNAHDEGGDTPLLMTDDDRVSLILLQAGADPRVKSGSVRAHAVMHHMPATITWLDAHGVP